MRMLNFYAFSLILSRCNPRSRLIVQSNAHSKQYESNYSNLVWYPRGAFLNEGLASNRLQRMFLACSTSLLVRNYAFSICHVIQHAKGCSSAFQGALKQHAPLKKVFTRTLKPENTLNQNGSTMIVNACYKKEQ